MNNDRIYIGNNRYVDKNSSKIMRELLKNIRSDLLKGESDHPSDEYIDNNK